MKCGYDCALYQCFMGIYFFLVVFIVIKKVNKSSSKQDFSALQPTDFNADYKDVERVYDQPEHPETIGKTKYI